MLLKKAITFLLTVSFLAGALLAHGNATHEPAVPISCCTCSARTPGAHLLAQVVREHKQHGQRRV